MATVATQSLRGPATFGIYVSSVRRRRNVGDSRSKGSVPARSSAAGNVNNDGSSDGTAGGMTWGITHLPSLPGVSGSLALARGGGPATVPLPGLPGTASGCVRRVPLRACQPGALAAAHPHGLRPGHIVARLGQAP